MKKEYVKFPDVKHQLYDDLGNPKRGFEIQVYEKNSLNEWHLNETLSTLAGSYEVLTDQAGAHHAYFRTGDSLIPLNSDFNNLTCGRCYVVGKEIPVVHKVVGNAVLAQIASQYGSIYLLCRQDYSDSCSFYYFKDPDGRFRVGHGDYDLQALLARLKSRFSHNSMISDALDKLMYCTADDRVMLYARYFCGEFDGLVISAEEYQALKETEELYVHDTVDYEPVFDGKIYETLSGSAAAQIAAFGFYFDDDRRVKSAASFLNELSQQYSPVYIDGFPYGVRLMSGGEQDDPIRFPNEWDKIMDLCDENNDLFHFDGIYSWCRDESYSADSMVQRGFRSARNWSYQHQTCCGDYVGYRPVLVPLDPETLKPYDRLHFIKNGSILRMGTLCMNEQGLNNPQTPTRFGDIPDYIRGSKLQIINSDPDVNKQIKWIKVGEVLIADRNLVKNISWHDLNAQGLVFGEKLHAHKKEDLNQLISNAQNKFVSFRPDGTRSALKAKDSALETENLNRRLP